MSFIISGAQDTDSLLNRPLPADGGEIRLWRIALDRPSDEVAGFRAGLPDADREAVDRFARADLRRRATVTRAALRHLLGRACGVRPQDVPLRRSAYGKPFLAGPGRPSFSVSHAADLALVAVRARGALGVDVEREEPGRTGEAMARYLLSPVELAVYEGLAPGRRRGLLTRWWTRKEAYAKAVGTGLSLDLTSVTLCGEDPPISIPLPGWTMCELPVPSPYIASLAVHGPVEAVFGADWSPT
ncbi:4'-phosphopantetheinyl transferase family protein [Streptomyces sp. NPDC059979]|uniref:4'-phosphopantetheinyl transferase family protein n=1 Tax=Streptomyces sp. NPDC059979 TaxID=3347021 RepID=UPI0036CA8AD9